jgi:hypothetical protein
MKYKIWKTPEDARKDINKPEIWAIIYDKALPFLANIQIPDYKNKYQLMLNFIKKLKDWDVDDLDFNLKPLPNGVKLRYKGRFDESIYVQVKIDDNNEIKELICSCFEQRIRKKNTSYLYVFSSKYN